MNEINLYNATGNNARYLSASSINELIACPLKFYFNHIEHLRVADDIVEYMDEGLFGTILHKVAEQSYMMLKKGNKPLTVTAALLDQLAAQKALLQKLVTEAINMLYNKLPSLAPDGQPYANTTPLVGEAKVIGNVMLKMMEQLFS